MSGRLLHQYNPRTQAQIAAQLYPEKTDAVAKQTVAPLAEPSESKSQQEIIRWWSAVHRSFGFDDERVLMAFPLQGARTKANGSRLKAEGMRKGCLDMQLIVARGGFHSFWCELKTSSGRLTESQESMIRTLSAQGCKVVVCRSCEEAMLEIRRYLTGATW